MMTEDREGRNPEQDRLSVSAPAGDAPPAEPAPPAQGDEGLQALLEFLAESRNFNYGAYRRGTLRRRLERRLAAVGVPDFAAYIDHLQANPGEYTPLFDSIVVERTGFFRDPEAWDYLRQEIVPRIVEARPAGAVVRAWCAGSATGEETYSLAMLLAEAVGAEAFTQRVKIYGTDIDDDGLRLARHAVYPNSALACLPPALRDKYFQQEPGHCTFRRDLRRALIFGHHDLTRDPPIAHVDLLLCRYMLVYYSADIQAQILPRLHFALNGNGCLFLGQAMALPAEPPYFLPANPRFFIYRKGPGAASGEQRLVTTPARPPASGERATLLLRLREAAFERTPLAQIVVDRNGTLTLANAEARDAFGLVLRDLGRPLQDLEISYRPVELRAQLDRAYAEGETVLLSDVERELPGGRRQYLDVQIVPLPDQQNAWIGASVVLIDVSDDHVLREDLERSRHDLQTAYEELQSTNEELETTNEELQATVHELETTNEELQSTNEELETINEELQSTNEELETTNAELRQRTDDLGGVNDLLGAVLGGLRVGVLAVDGSLNVLVWNRAMEELWGLRQDEVQGQPLIGLDIGLPVDRLVAPLRSLIDGQRPSQELVLPATDRRGRAIQTRIMATPLRGAQEQPRGAIMLMEPVPPSEPAARPEGENDGSRP